MRKNLDRLYKFSGFLAAVSLLAIMAIVFAQVVLNILDFISIKLLNKSYGFLIPSYASFSGYALGFSTFLALGLGFRHAAHIRVTLVESMLKPAAQRWTLSLVALLGVLMGCLFTWGLGQVSYESWLWGDTASGLIRVPIWIPQSVLTVGALIFTIAALDTLIEMLRDGHSSALKVIEPTKEQM